MGLFSFFNRKNGSLYEKNGNGTSGKTPEVSEEIFVEKNKPASQDSELKVSGAVESGINVLFEFLERNFEAKGYDDALINPDSTHLDQNISAIQNDLHRTIRKVKTFYEDFIRRINVHIASRGRSGMVDTVEELIAKKETAENHIRQVIEIEEQSRNNQGVGQGIIISYTRGFRNGLAAISHHDILRKNF